MLEVNAETRLNERRGDRARVQEHRVALKCLSSGAALAFCCDAVRRDDANPTGGIDHDCAGERGVLRSEDLLPAGHDPPPGERAAELPGIERECGGVTRIAHGPSLLFHERRSQRECDAAGIHPHEHEPRPPGLARAVELELTPLDTIGAGTPTDSACKRGVAVPAAGRGVPAPPRDPAIAVAHRECVHRARGSAGVPGADRTGRNGSRHPNGAGCPQNLRHAYRSRLQPAY